MEGWEVEGGRSRPRGWDPGACRRARDPPNSFPGCLGQRSGPRSGKGFLVLDFPLGEYLAPLNFQDKASQLSSLILPSCSLSGPIWRERELGWPRPQAAGSLLAPPESCTSSRMDSPLLPLANLALGPSPTRPQTQESSLLWFRPHSLLCGSCFAQSLGLGGGEEWGALPFQDFRLTRLQKVPFLTKSPPFSTGYG